MTRPLPSNMKINDARLWDSLMEMAKIGPGIAGGNNRQTLTDADGQARALFRSWCDAAGLSTGIDEIGSMFAMRPGTDPDALPVYVGSHLDTQPTGGKFDGVLGVLAGLEIVRTLNDLGLKTRHPVVVTNWTNEEGTRFAPAMLASGVFTGRHDVQWALDRRDADGLRLGDELERIGWKGPEKAGARKIHAFFELHIEQGPILEAAGIPIGIVTHGQGLSWMEVSIKGNAAHTGSTPMSMRKNAGLAMAAILLEVDRIAWAHQPQAVGAVGHIDIFPNSRNVIPDRAVFTVDFRAPDKDVIAQMEESLDSQARQICDKMGVAVSLTKAGGFDPVTFDPGCVAVLRKAAKNLGHATLDLVSGAGHDACAINSVAPSAMVMCPCVDGLSHNEAEDIRPEWARAGTEVLLHAVLETAVIED